MKILIFSPSSDNTENDKYRICVLGIQFGELVIGFELDFNWRGD